ncbi:MAG: DNA-binding response regulator [Gammaproteobacteria bacterium RIFCSPLOWO2_12_FULL_38_14]|nr:MAG: DNA-binding response regulator [Gammaproteobacteria bacterium RIFCSPLOWO2_12_FULL_38_14]
MHILLIEDNEKTVNYLLKGLKENYFTVDAACDGQTGLFMATQNTYDLILLDVMLPHIDGWTIITTLRNKNITTPVLFLTAKDTLDDKIKGLKLGADDYLIKPFSFSELVARIHSLLRRNQHYTSEILKIADLVVDTQKHKAFRNNAALLLSAKEFMLLVFFLKRKGEVLSRTLIAEQVWDINFDNDSNAIDVAVKRLREKIDKDFSQKLLHTVRGVGYVLEER